jgi:DNA-binding MarR family transcriptional regulator
MVERAPAPEDRRVVRLVAAEAGRRVVHAVTERRRAEIAEIVAAMPHEDRGAMVQALQAFADAAGELQTDPTAYTGLLLPAWT